MTQPAPDHRHDAGGPLDPLEHRNDVVVRGRLSRDPQPRDLPSGDQLVACQLVVERPVRHRGAGIDVIDCVAWSGASRRAAARWRGGDVVEISGTLRRRFWRGPGGVTRSRYEVEIDRGRRMAFADGRLTRRRSSG